MSRFRRYQKYQTQGNDTFGTNYSSNSTRTTLSTSSTKSTKCMDESIKKIARQLYAQGSTLMMINRYLLNQGKCSKLQAIEIIKEISHEYCNDYLNSED